MRVTRRFGCTLSVFCVLLAVCSIIYINRNGTFFNRTNQIRSQTSIYQIESTREHSFFIYESSLLIANNEGLTLINSSGAVVWELEIVTKSPIVKVAGKYILVADRDGNNVYIASNGRIVAKVSIEQSIINANVNPHGVFTIVSTETGYKNKVTVYTTKGEEFYTWKVSENYILDTAVSRNGRYLAASTISTAEDKLSGGVVIIDIDNSSLVAENSFDNKFYVGLVFNDDNSLVAIGDNDAKIFSVKGEEIRTINYYDRTLQKFDYSAGDNIVLSFLNGRNTSTIESYSAKGIIKGKCELEFTADFLGAANSRIMACSKREVVLTTHNGSIKKDVTLPKDFRWAGLLPNRRELFVICGNSIELVAL